VADTIYTRTLANAAEAQGSTQALATLLHVPENTLLRWMSGRAQMPLQAFLKLIEYLVQYENRGGNVTRPDANGEPLTFAMGELLARCARCDGTEFSSMQPGPLKLTAELQCRSCGERVVHGDLISQLAKDAVYQSRTYTAARTRRQTAMLQASPKLRALQEAAKKKENLASNADD
jgi:DNA-directed RNA polymerase subunit RPC12/RpoP